MELSHQPERNDSALDVIEHELYNPKNKMDDMTLHHIRDKRQTELPTSWGDNAAIITHGKEDKGFSFGTKVLLISILFLIIVGSFEAWNVLSSRNIVSSTNIDMALDITPYAEGGESIPLTFTLLNRNSAALQGASITLEYKQGIGTQDEQEKVHEKRDLGTINQNDNKRQDFTVILYGSEAEQRDLTIKLEYKVAGSNATFSKVVTASTVLKTPQIGVHIDGPDLLSVGQSGTFIITVKNNSATTSLPGVLQVTLPNTFTIISQEPKSSTKGTVWGIPALLPGDIATTTITGSLTGTQGETTSMKAQVGSQGSSATSIGVVYSSQTVDIKLRTSPLSFSVAMDTDGGKTDTLRYGDRATLMVNYINTSDKALQDVKLILSVKGNAALYKTIDPINGYYDSEKQTIAWDKTTLPELGTLLPHAYGNVRIVVPIVISGSNSPTLKIEMTGIGTAQEKNDVVSTISKTWGVQGSATVRAETTYKNSPFVNTGPVPPQPNKETTYTVHLVVSAQNGLTNTRVSFRLPTYVTWRNISSDTAKVSFDESTRTVTWSLGDLASEKNASMDISLSVKPSQSHVNQMPAITSGIVLDADEVVSHAHLQTTISALTTYIANENWDGNPSRVVGQ